MGSMGSSNNYSHTTPHYRHRNRHLNNNQTPIPLPLTIHLAHLQPPKAELLPLW